jgi:hypothetical protein
MVPPAECGVCVSCRQHPSNTPSDGVDLLYACTFTSPEVGMVNRSDRGHRRQKQRRLQRRPKHPASLQASPAAAPGGPARGAAEAQLRKKTTEQDRGADALLRQNERQNASAHLAKCLYRKPLAYLHLCRILYRRSSWSFTNQLCSAIISKSL